MLAIHTRGENDVSAEGALVSAAKQGDLGAFEKLVQSHSRIVFRVALHISRCREDAEEIAQEAFLRAFQHLKTFEGKARLATWLSRITINVALRSNPMGAKSSLQMDQNQLGTQSTADVDLVQSAKQGDKTALEELVRRNMKRVFAIAYHITRSREDAEEVSQETFIKACCRLKDFEERAQFTTWLTRIAVNTALTQVGRSNLTQNPSSQLTGTVEEIVDWRPNPEELYSRYQLRQQLRQALEKLPQMYSTVFLLRDMQGLSIAETAAALQLSVSTVKTRLLRARLQLREILSRPLIPTWTEVDHARSNLIARVLPLAAQLVGSK